MTKVLFLDMDGVLNSHAYAVKRNRAHPEHERLPWDRHDPRRWAEMIDPAAVMRLNQICDQAGAKVVISSSWRYAHDVAMMKRILDIAGFTGEVIGETPNDMHAPARSHEISAWLAQNPGTTRFVVLDDGKSAGEGLEKWFVHTDLAVGLTDEDVKKAILILGRIR